MLGLSVHFPAHLGGVQCPTHCLVLLHRLSLIYEFLLQAGVGSVDTSRPRSEGHDNSQVRTTTLCPPPPPHPLYHRPMDFFGRVLLIIFEDIPGSGLMRSWHFRWWHVSIESRRTLCTKALHKRPPPCVSRTYSKRSGQHYHNVMVFCVASLDNE